MKLYWIFLHQGTDLLVWIGRCRSKIRRLLRRRFALPFFFLSRFLRSQCWCASIAMVSAVNDHGDGGGQWPPVETDSGTLSTTSERIGKKKEIEQKMSHKVAKTNERPLPFRQRDRSFYSWRGEKVGQKKKKKMKKKKKKNRALKFIR